MDFSAEQARKLQTTNDYIIKCTIMGDFKVNVWDNEKLNRDLVNILYDILLVAQTQYTKIIRELSVSDENIEELKRLGYTIEKDEDNHIIISF